jgi:hypothetical protein
MNVISMKNIFFKENIYSFKRHIKKIYFLTVTFLQSWKHSIENDTFCGLSMAVMSMTQYLLK